MALTVMVLVVKSIIPSVVYHCLIMVIENLDPNKFFSPNGSSKWLSIVLLLNLTFLCYSLYILKKSGVVKLK
jgi:hypothetical protein